MKNVGVIYPEKLSYHKYSFYGDILEITSTDLAIISTLCEEADPKMHLIRLKSVKVNSNLSLLYEFLPPKARRLKLKNITPGDKSDKEALLMGLRHYTWEVYGEMNSYKRSNPCFKIIGIK